MLIQIIWCAVKKAVKEILFDDKEHQVTLELNNVWLWIYVVIKELILVCSKSVIKWSVTLIRYVELTIIMIERQLRRMSRSLNKRNIFNELTSNLHDLMHAIDIDAIVFCRQETAHTVVNNLIVDCFKIAISSLNSLIFQLKRKNENLISSSLLCFHRFCSFLDVEFSKDLITHDRKMLKCKESQLMIRYSEWSQRRWWESILDKEFARLNIHICLQVVKNLKVLR